MCWGAGGGRACVEGLAVGVSCVGGLAGACRVLRGWWGRVVYWGRDGGLVGVEWVWVCAVGDWRLKEWAGGDGAFCCERNLTVSYSQDTFPS